MNIGDKVRHLQGTEEGIITKFLGHGQVEVEIEDGFRIPFEATSLVVVSAMEDSYFKEKEPINYWETDKKKKKKKEDNKHDVYAEQGLYMAFSHRNDQELEVWLINNTDTEVLFSLGEEEAKNYQGISSGRITARKHQKVHEMNLAKFERWPALVLQALRFKQGYQNLLKPLERRLKWKASSFHKHKKQAPILDKEAYVFQLDVEIKKVDVEKLKDAMQGNKPAAAEPSLFVKHATSNARKEAKKEVDLHIEAIVPDYARLNPGPQLELQLQRFEEALDLAILADLEKVVFIHGVGAGVLKGQIHSRLSKDSRIKHYKEARKEKFGYGATEVRLK